MKRPVVLIVGAAAGALLIAGIGASAHSGFAPAKLTGVHSGVFGDEASGAEVTTPETTPEPTDTPEPAQAAEPADTDTETEDDSDENGATGATINVQVGSGDHETGDKQTSGGGESGD
jgi:hypothetical protein